jgi:hypothetical protein
MSFGKWLLLGGFIAITSLLLSCTSTQVVRETVVVTQVVTQPPPTAGAAATSTAVANSATPGDTPTETLVATQTIAPTTTLTEVPVVPTALSTITPSPAPTLTPPVVLLPPFDGGMNIAQIGPNSTDPNVTTSLVFEVEANDISAGDNNGDGIANVDMRVLDANNHTVYQHTEAIARYCLFGAGEPDCNVWEFADHGNKWPNGAPVQPGTFFLRATAHTPGGRIRAVEAAVYIYLAPNPSEAKVSVDIVQTVPGDNTSDVTSALVFQAEASYSNVGSNDGAGIDHVESWIVDLNGNVVYQQTERNVKYCAFGGGDANCDAWDLAQHANKWPSGAPIYSSDYFLRAVAYAADGTTGAADQQITVRLNQ